MSSVLSLVLACVLILLFPILFLGWLTESKTTRIKRMAQTMSQRQIAAKLKISRYRVAKALAAA